MGKPRRTSLKSRDQIRATFLSVHISAYKGYDFTFTFGWGETYSWHGEIQTEKRYQWRVNLVPTQWAVSILPNGPFAAGKKQCRPLKLNFCLFRIFQCVACLKNDRFCTAWLLAAKGPFLYCQQFSSQHWGVRPYIRMSLSIFSTYSFIGITANKSKNLSHSWNKSLCIHIRVRLIFSGTSTVLLLNVRSPAL